MSFIPSDLQLSKKFPYEIRYSNLSINLGLILHSSKVSHCGLKLGKSELLSKLFLNEISSDMLLDDGCCIVLNLILSVLSSYPIEKLLGLILDSLDGFQI
jgi:hypothetical protein